MDKTHMCEAAVLSGMKHAICVKYRLSTFHNNYNNKYCIAWIKNKEENPAIQGNILKKCRKRKIKLLIQCCCNTVNKLPRSGFVVRPRGRFISIVRVHAGVCYSFVAEGNCVAERRGGEQPEANCRSAG